MPRSLGTPQQQRLRQFLIAKRKAAGLTQAQVAARLNRHQPFVALVESGQRRIDLVELVEIAAVLGFDPHAALDAILTSQKRRT